MDPITILAALGPLAIDAGKALIQKFFAPDEFKPANIEQYVQMRTLDLDMFKAMNEAGGTNQSYLWVEAIVRLMRPVAAIIVMVTWAWSSLSGSATPAIDNFASAIGFYLFGDRTLFYSRKALTK
jgi:hypothetical protein